MHVSTRRTVLGALVSVSLSLGVPAPGVAAAVQNANPPQSTFRITSDAVRLDVIVTDKRGNPVPGLTADDFVVLQNREWQEILTCSYISAALPGADEKDGNVGSQTQAPAIIRHDKRWITIAVNDVDLSLMDVHKAFVYIARVRQQLKKFVEQQVGPDDEVSIVQASGGAGILLPFTSDKRMLGFLVDKLQFQVRGFFPERGVDSAEVSTFLTDAASLDAVRVLEDFLASLEPRMKELEALPGKKVLVILNAATGTPGLTPNGIEYERRRARLLWRFSDHATRTGTTVYAYSVSGLEVPLGFDATSWDAPPGTHDQVPASLPEMPKIWEQVARRTGGFAKSDNSFIVSGLRSALRDLSGYYVLSYRPPHGTFHDVFNNIEVKVKKKGLVVRSAAGFFGTISPEASTEGSVGTAENSLEASFSYHDLDVRLTSLFIGDRKQGSIRSWLLVDPRGLTFVDEGGGKSASLDVQVGLYRAGTLDAARYRSTRSLHVSDAAFQSALEKGYVLNILSPPLPPGDYCMRVVAMDPATKKVGSAFQLVQVPNLKKKFTLSGILMADRVVSDEPTGETGSSGINLDFGPGVRRFRPGMKVQFASVVYNPPRDKRTGVGRFEYQVRILNEEGVAYAGPQQVAELPAQSKEAPAIAGEVTLGANLKPGSYILELTAREPGSRNSKKSATQIIDFQIQ